MVRFLFMAFGCILAVSCGPGALKPTPPPPPTHSYYSAVFQVIDSTGVVHGAGYDIYDGDKTIIHQTTIPGESGLDGFANDEEARKVAELVIQKLEAGGGFPTISHDELVTLGITLKSK